MTSWNQIMAALENVDFVDVILIIGFLYIVASYYTRNFGENDDVPAKNRSDASTDESSFARGDGWQRDSIGLHSGKPGAVGNEEYEMLMAEIADMKKRQEKTDETIANLHAIDTKRPETSSNRGLGKIDENGSGLNSLQQDAMTADQKHCCATTTNMAHNSECNRRFNALYTDFDNLQKNNEKLARKYDALKLRFSTLEREVTKNSSVLMTSSFRGAFAAFDDRPQTAALIDQQRTTGLRSYSDGPSYPRHSTDTVRTTPTAAAAAAVPVLTNDVVVEPVMQSVPCSLPPPPPPPPLPSSSRHTAPQPPMKIDQKVYRPIPITTDILKTVVLTKPGESRPTIKVPVGMIQPKRKTTG